MNGQINANHAYILQDVVRWHLHGRRLVHFIAFKSNQLLLVPRKLAMESRSCRFCPHKNRPIISRLVEATAPLLDCDPTLWIISAWNDNGFDAWKRFKPPKMRIFGKCHPMWYTNPWKEDIIGSSVVYFIWFQSFGLAGFATIWEPQGIPKGIKDFLNLEFLQACAIMCQYFRKAHSLPAVTTSLVFFCKSCLTRCMGVMGLFIDWGGILCGTRSFLSTEKKHGRYLHGNGRSWRFTSRTSRFAWDWCHFDFSLNSYRQNIDTEHEAICSRLHKKSPVSWFNHVQPSGLHLRLLSRFLWGPYSKDSMYIACDTSLWFPSVQVCAKHSTDA